MEEGKWEIEKARQAKFEFCDLQALACRPARIPPFFV
jgi:hypothetical protein